MNSTEIDGKKPDSPLWTTSDVARFLGCSERQVYNLRLHGLPSIRVQGLVRFIPRSVQAWLVNQNPYAGDDERAQQLDDTRTEENGVSNDGDLFHERHDPTL